LSKTGINFFVAALAMGMATMVMVTIRVLLGRAIGTLIKRREEIVSGVFLVLVGAFILYERLA
jgi:putative Mn2+ efflux pump MntP